jgi:integrase
MTALALRQLVQQALADVGVSATFLSPKGRPRTTTWIGVEHGFGIRHYASGRKVYIVQSRMGGRVRTITIGPATVLSQHQATMVARRVLAHAMVGHDPATTRKRCRGAPRFKDFLDEYWAKCAPAWKDSTFISQTTYRRNHLDDAFPDMFVDGLDEAHVARWFAGLTDRAGPGGANQVLGILNAAMKKAEAWGYRLENTNPCRNIRRNKRRKCERFLSDAELARMGAVLNETRGNVPEFEGIAGVIVTLVMLTGCRIGEVLSLQWPDVQGSRLKLRDSKTGAKTVWLGDDARQLIAGLPRYKNIPWLFWNASYRRRIKSLKGRWTQMRNEAGLAGLRLHDLRHTYASHAARHKETLPMIGRLLGHATVQSTARYTHLDDDHVLDAAEQVGLLMQQALGE